MAAPATYGGNYCVGTWMKTPSGYVWNGNCGPGILGNPVDGYTHTPAPSTGNSHRTPPSQGGPPTQGSGPTTGPSNGSGGDSLKKEPTPHETPPPEGECGAGVPSHSTDSLMNRKMSGSGGQLNIQGGLPERWSVPSSGKEIWFNVVAAMTDDKVRETVPALVNVIEGMITSYHQGSGPGGKMLLPPELDLRYIYGFGGASGTNEEMPTPASISEPMDIVFADLDGSTRISGSRAWGTVIARATGEARPSDGVYEKMDDAGYLCIQRTDAAGDDQNTQGVKVNGYPVQTHDLQEIDETTALAIGASFVTIHCDDTGGVAFTVTLPGMADAAGHTYRIVNIGLSGYAVTVEVKVGDILLGTLNDSFVLNDGEALMLTASATKGWA